MARFHVTGCAAPIVSANSGSLMSRLAYSSRSSERRSRPATTSSRMRKLGGPTTKMSSTVARIRPISPRTQARSRKCTDWSEQRLTPPPTRQEATRQRVLVLSRRVPLRPQPISKRQSMLGNPRPLRTHKVRPCPSTTQALGPR